MSIEIYIRDRRTGSMLASGKITRVSNDPGPGTVRLLALSLDTGYEMKMYCSKAEMDELLATFPPENKETP